MEKIIEVAVPIPSKNNFLYKINTEEIEIIGKRVEVPFGKRTLIGVITKVFDIDSNNNPNNFQLKSANKIIDSTRVFPVDLFTLSKYISEKYFVSQGEAFSTMLSTSAHISKKKIEESKAKHNLEAGFLSTPQQKLIIDKISEKINKNIFSKNLIFGVSDSGKTEVYLKIIDYALSKNKDCIYLVPEIALLPQIEKILKNRFGNIVSVLHHRLTPVAKYLTWQNILSGKIKIVLGARSAIFAPVADLGVIIIDEEHSESYKQDKAPTYNTHDIAEYRAEIKNANVIYGSATPSIETIYKMQNNSDSEIFYLREKISSAKNEIIICDLKKEKMFSQFISEKLKNAIADCLDKGEQAVLFINRRGFYRYLYCFDCGSSFKCPDCSVSMVYHYDDNNLQCHLCGKIHNVPSCCPVCGNLKMKFMGYGTERIEDEIKKIFPLAKVTRLDRDISDKKGFYDEFFEKFRTKQIDIGIGTQILIKGFDFPFVTLTGVIYLDGMFNIPDYTASSRCLSLIVQASGRSGRGENPAKTIIQTINPEIDVLKYMDMDGYVKFIDNELEIRKKHQYPPFKQFVRIIFSDFDKNLAKENAEIFFNKLKKDVQDICFYPICAPFYEKVAKKYRFQLVIRGELTKVINYLEPYRDFLLKNRSKGIHIEIEPSDLL